MARPNNLSPGVRRAPRGLIAAVLLITALVGGKALADTQGIDPLTARLNAAIAQDAAFLVRIQTQLLSYDRVVQMRVARGAIAAEQVPRLLRQRAEDLMNGTVSVAAEVVEERQEAQVFFAAIESAAGPSAHWPTLQSPAFYRAYVAVVLVRAKAEHEAGLGGAGDGAAQALDDAYRALELTRGREGDPTTPFSDPYSRTFAAMGLPDPPAMPPVTVSPRRLEVNVDRPGQDIAVLELATDNVLDCESTCARNASCQTFTFVYSGVQGAKAKCWLKNGVPAPRSDPCCISEVK